MKKTFALSIFVSAVIIFSSCKKNDPTPIPLANTPTPTNQPSATAPSLNSGTETRLTVYSGNRGVLELSEIVTDPQGDDWTVTSATSSNTSVATIEIASNDGMYAIAYTGVSTGTTTITIVVADDNGHSNTLTFRLTVSQSPNAPTLNAGVNTSLSVQAGSVATWDLRDKVTTGSEWSIISVTSSNTTVATVSRESYADIQFTGQSAGTATMTVTLSDGTNTSTFTATINVTPAPAGPIVVVQNPTPVAPTLNPGVNTTLSVQAGSNVFWNLSDKVTDPQGDTWTITSVVSSNTAVLTVGLNSSQELEYAGVDAGTATMTVTLSDGTNTSTFTATVSVAPKFSSGGGGGPK